MTEVAAGRLAVWLAAFMSLCQPTSPRRQAIVAFLAGMASILAMAPFHAWPVLWVTLPALLLVADSAVVTDMSGRASRWVPWRRSAVGRLAEVGWWFGFGYHLVGLFWIGEAFLVEADVFAWLLPLAVTLLPAGLAMFTALAVASLGIVRRSLPLDRVLVLALSFGMTEWLRGHILTGFPWNVFGYALTWPLPLMQSAALVGVYGLTILTVLIFASPYVAIAASGTRAALQVPACAALALIAMLAFGQWRLTTSPVTAPADGSPLIRVVQPSIPQRERMQANTQRRIFDRHLALSITAPDGTIDDAAAVDLIVWPEAAMPFVPLAQPAALAEIGSLLQGNTRLVSGALRVGDSTRPGTRAVFNSLLVFEGGAPARHVGTYDKIHLVPFGEYLPAQSVLEMIGLQQITRQRGGFTPGSGPRTLLDLPGIGRVQPLICYEAVFPGLLTPALGRPDLLLTLTNDGWFGTTTGPRQHYHQGRVRAVETGVPLLRASSNGISAMIDPLGRERARLELNAVGTFDTRLPQPVTATPYARWGDRTMLLGLLVLAFIVGRSRQKLHPRQQQL